MKPLLVGLALIAGGIAVGCIADENVRGALLITFIFGVAVTLLYVVLKVK